MIAVLRQCATLVLYSVPRNLGSPVVRTSMPIAWQPSSIHLVFGYPPPTSRLIPFRVVGMCTEVEFKILAVERNPRGYHGETVNCIHSASEWAVVTLVDTQAAACDCFVSGA